jgi:16S rRNA processing protein RimM
VVVNVETDFPEERFKPQATLFVRRGETVESLTITTVRFQQGRPIVGLAGVDDVDGARAYAGAELRVPAAWLAPLPEGVFYRHDLVGCEVVTRDGAVVGLVREVEGTMSGSRLVLDTPEGEVLIPLAVDICVSIEPRQRRIVIEPPDGLLELNITGRRSGQAR